MPGKRYAHPPDGPSQLTIDSYGLQEIDGSDMKLAINLCDRKLVDSASQARRAIEVADEINAQPLGNTRVYLCVIDILCVSYCFRCRRNTGLCCAQDS